MSRLDQQTASRFVRLTLGHLTREWPNKLDHVMMGPEDVASPSALHPIFYGSFDWHSCVHGWWQVMRILRRFPDLDEAPAILTLANEMLVPDKAAVELAYLERPASAAFERPYGWGWLLALHAELAEHDAPWSAVIEPMARLIARRLDDYLGKMTYPIRVGTHFNSAFALTLSLYWAERHDGQLAGHIRRAGYRWYKDDRACQAWEPGGDEFLSSALSEALFMSAALDRRSFTEWFGHFLPHFAEHRPATLFTPAFVSDRSDGKIAHLDGLNLSRAWCLRRIARALGREHPLSGLLRTNAEAHLHAALPHLADDYAGEHWIATFAMLALEA